MLIRDATPDDAEALGRIVTRSWQVAYRGIFSDEFLDGLDPHAAATRWSESLNTGGEFTHLLVAASDAGVVGMCAAGGPTDDAPELRMLYLDPEAWGQGIGRALQDAMLERMRADGYRAAVLWCEPSNINARAFYARTGWNDDGIGKTEIWANGLTVQATRYSRSL